MSKKKYLKNPLLVVVALGRRGFFNWMSDRKYLKMVYFCRMHKKLNLDNPVSFNEKIQWLKLYQHNPQYIKMVDKFEAKKIASVVIGDEYVIPTIGVWDSFDNIDFSTLPNQFVLKCTHDSGGLVICKDKSKLNISDARKKINNCLKRNYYWYGREWPYKNVKPRIIAEPYMENKDVSELLDYKVFNFNGEPRLIQVDYNRFKSHKKNLYKPDWSFMNISINYPNDPNHQIEKPAKLDTMLELSRKLSKGLPFVRTDFYCIDEKIFFGEITFFPGSGFMTFDPEKMNTILGKQINLPQDKTV